jgi:hypothetical protein
LLTPQKPGEAAQKKSAASEGKRGQNHE